VPWLGVPPWPLWLGAAVLPLLVCGAAGWLELKGVEKRLEGELAPADSGTEDILRGVRVMNGWGGPAPPPSPWLIGNAPMLPFARRDEGNEWRERSSAKANTSAAYGTYACSSGNCTGLTTCGAASDNTSAAYGTHACPSGNCTGLTTCGAASAGRESIR
jgi:hypothetical protein